MAYPAFLLLRYRNFNVTKVNVGTGLFSVFITVSYALEIGCRCCATRSPTSEDAIFMRTRHQCAWVAKAATVAANADDAAVFVLGEPLVTVPLISLPMLKTSLHSDFKQQSATPHAFPLLTEPPPEGALQVRLYLRLVTYSLGV